MTAPDATPVTLLHADRERITASPLVDDEVLVPVVLSADIDREWIQAFNHVRAHADVPAQSFALIPPRTVLVTIGSTTDVRARIGLLRELIDITNVRLAQLRERRLAQSPSPEAAAARITQVNRDLDALGL
jgi:hypothetical protein